MQYYKDEEIAAYASDTGWSEYLLATMESDRKKKLEGVSDVSFNIQRSFLVGMNWCRSNALPDFK